MGHTKYFFPKGIKIKGTRLTPVEIVLVPTKNRSRAMYKCLCDCGNTAVIVPSSIGAGLTRSCGCLKREFAIARRTTHGLSKTREYAAARAAYSRCKDKSNKYYRIYGGRGIKCVFKTPGEMTKWLIEYLPKPKQGKTCIDRINNNGHYEPGNLRWATCKESIRNRNVVPLVTIGGITKPAVEWAESVGIVTDTLLKRIKKGLPESLWLFKGTITSGMLWKLAYAKE